MAKQPTLTDVSSGHQSATTFNNNFTEIKEHFDGFLSLNGDTPNSMGADFDLNSNDILNGGVGNFSSILVNGSPIAPNVTVTVEGVRPETYGENTTPGTTDMTGAIRSAIAYLKTQGGGDLYLAADTYLITDTITIDSPIRIIGQGWSFLNDYTDNEVILRGTWFTKPSGTDFDMFVFTGDTSLTVGGNYPRVHARIEKVGVHGNKSSTATPTDVDAGAGGSGISCQGASYVSISDVCVFRCADNGVESTTFAYGGSLGTASSNNLKLHKVYCLQNAGNGFSMFGGDSIFDFLVGGFNGLDGFNGNMGPLSGSRFWNNQRRGITIQGNTAGSGTQVPPMVCTHNYVYDNLDTGILISSGEGHIVGNNAVFDNGRDVSSSGNDRAGIAISSTADNVVISNNVMGRYNYGGKAGYGAGNQLYGIAAVSGTPAVKIASNVYVGHDVWDPADIGNLVSLTELNITDKSDMEYHDSLGGDASIPHPGFQATGPISMGGFRIEDLAGVVLSGATVTSVPSNVLETSNRSFVTFNDSTNRTANSINSTLDTGHFLIIRNIGSGSLTLTHNSSAIRCNGQTNVVLDTNEAATFIKVSSGIWQQV